MVYCPKLGVSRVATGIYVNRSYSHWDDELELKDQLLQKITYMDFLCGWLLAENAGAFPADCACALIACS